MLKRLLISILITTGLLMGGFATAQGFSIWYPNDNNKAQLIDDTWGLQIVGLAGPGTECLQIDNTGVISGTGAECGSGGSGSGTVTSVDMSVPTGLLVSGNPITASGTLTVTYDTGYEGLLTSDKNNWNTAYGWGDHSIQNYFDIDTQTLDNIPNGTTYKLLTATKDGYINQDVTNGSSPTFLGLTLNNIGYTFPSSDGTNGYTLKTNGSGTLTWSADNNTTYTAGTNLTLTGTEFNVDDAFIKNNTSDTMTGTLTADGLTLGANENITLGSYTLKNDGTDFVFNDSVKTNSTSTAASLDITNGSHGMKVYPGNSTTTISFY